MCSSDLTRTRIQPFTVHTDEFTRTQLLEEAVAMGIKENTAITWLKRLTKHGKLISMDGKGLYARACVYE